MERKQTFVLSRGEAAQARGGGETEDGKGVTVRREGKRWAGTIPVRAAAGRNIRNAVCPKEETAGHNREASEFEAKG